MIHPKKSKKQNKIIEKAICITLGEQSENHVGMAKQGKGLSKHGYSVRDLQIIKDKFEKKGGQSEWLCLNDSIDECKDTEKAVVLVMRDGINQWLGDQKAKDNLMKELETFEWDKQYWDVRRQKWLNKHARYNVCFGEHDQEFNKDEKRGSIISYDRCPTLKKWKEIMENQCEMGQKLEAEGNLYYNVKKTGIGFHGDGERKKVIACNVSDANVVREIHWQWYEMSKRIGKRIIVPLYHGDCYIMSEKASGFDWKKRVRTKIVDGQKIKLRHKTVRHAAGVKGSKYLK